MRNNELELRSKPTEERSSKERAETNHLAPRQRGRFVKPFGVTGERRRRRSSCNRWKPKSLEPAGHAEAPEASGRSGCDQGPKPDLREFGWLRAESRKRFRPFALWRNPCYHSQPGLWNSGTSLRIRRSQASSSNPSGPPRFGLEGNEPASLNLILEVLFRRVRLSPGLRQRVFFLRFSG